MNNAEQDMRIIDLERRITHLTQASSGEWALLKHLNRRLIALAHRIYLLERDADPIQPNYAALADEEPVSQSKDSRDSAGI